MQKTNFYSSTQSWDESDITLGKPRHAWPPDLTNE